MSSTADRTTSRKDADSERSTVRVLHVITWLTIAVALFLASVAVGGSDSVGAAEASKRSGVQAGSSTNEYLNTRNDNDIVIYFVIADF
jgi:hypothetical protein